MQSLEDIPSLFSTAWGIDLVSAQLIISAFVILALVLPVLTLRVSAKQKSGFAIEIILAFIGMSLCVGLGWLPIWVLLVGLLLTAFAGAIVGRDTIFGG